MKIQRNSNNGLFGLRVFFLHITSVKQNGEMSELILIHYGVNAAQKTRDKENEHHNRSWLFTFLTSPLLAPHLRRNRFGIFNQVTITYGALIKYATIENGIVLG